MSEHHNHCHLECPSAPSPLTIPPPRNEDRYALRLGFMIGALMQVSCLGANFIHAESLFFILHRQPSTTSSSSLPFWMAGFDGIRFTLQWSAMVSLVGMIMWGLTTLLMRAMTVHSQHFPHHHDQERWATRTVTFATGTVTGLCGAWILTDVATGGIRHGGYCLLTWLLVLGLMRLSSAVMPPHSSPRVAVLPAAASADHHDEQQPGEVKDSLNVPLLSASYLPHKEQELEQASLVQEEEIVYTSSPRLSLPWIRVYSCLLGILVGQLVQMGSLGMNYLWIISSSSSSPSASSWGTASSTLGQGTVPFSWPWVMLSSMMWSMVVSGLGVGILVLLRSWMINIIHHKTTVQTSFERVKGSVHMDPEKVRSAEFHWGDHVQAVHMLEGWFSICTLMGFHGSWWVMDQYLWRGAAAHRPGSSQVLPTRGRVSWEPTSWCLFGPFLFLILSILMLLYRFLQSATLATYSCVSQDVDDDDPNVMEDPEEPKQRPMGSRSVACWSWQGFYRECDDHDDMDDDDDNNSVPQEVWENEYDLYWPSPSSSGEGENTSPLPAQ